MKKFKQIAEDWAEKELEKQPLTETNNKMKELMVLGSLLYDNDGNWIPRLEENTKFKITEVYDTK